MKRSTLLVLVAGLILATRAVAAGSGEGGPARPADADAPLLVTDAPAGQSIPRNLRALDRVPSPRRAITPPLAASGSAQFTIEGLQAVRALTPQPIVVVDLRGESHGFLGDRPVSWYATNNWANLDRPQGYAEQDESARLAELARQRTVVLSDAAEKKAGRQAGPRESVTVRDVESEQHLVEAHGMKYFRLRVPDHLRPDDAAVDEFVRFVGQVPEGTWLHFHCRAGKGRTTTFLVMYDALRHARTLTFEEIVARQTAPVGDYDLLNKDGGETGPKSAWQGDRATFLRRFYTYAQQHPNGSGMAWSEWSREK